MKKFLSSIMSIMMLLSLLQTSSFSAKSEIINENDYDFIIKATPSVVDVNEKIFKVVYSMESQGETEVSSVGISLDFKNCELQGIESTKTFSDKTDLSDSDIDTFNKYKRVFYCAYQGDCGRVEANGDILTLKFKADDDTNNNNPIEITSEIGSEHTYVVEENAESETFLNAYAESLCFVINSNGIEEVTTTTNTTTTTTTTTKPTTTTQSSTTTPSTAQVPVTFPSKTRDYERTIDGITYKVISSEKMAVVLEVDEAIATANILAEVDGYKVKSINPDAFKKCSYLTKIKGYKGSCAEVYANDNEILFEATIDTIEGCKYEFDVANEVATIVGYEKSANIINIYDYVYGHTVTRINEYAFWNCELLTECRIPNGTLTIGEKAFGNCKSLANITIPNGVLKIGYRAFYNCTSLTSITIPNSVTSIGNEAFEGCSKLNEIKGYSGSCAEKYAKDNGIPFVSIDKPTTTTTITSTTVTTTTTTTSTTVEKPITTSNSTSSTMTPTTTVLETTTNSATQTPTTITNETGSYKKTIDNITYTVNTINKTVSVTDIDESTTEAKVVSKVDEYKVTDIKDGLFANCTQLKKVTIPGSITEIEDTFANCESVIEIEIEDGVEKIGNRAFVNCTSLTTITIPNSIKDFSTNAFDGCDSIKTVKCYPNSIAETFATMNGLEYVLITSQPITQPTATTTNKEITTIPTETLKGDANGDGKISVADARKIIVAIANEKTDEITIADVNGDGKVTVADARKLIVAIAKNEYM